MNSVYFPAHVAVVLRRIANVLGGISISNQYLVLRKARAEEVNDSPEPFADNRTSKALDKLSRWASLKGRQERASQRWECSSTLESPGVPDISHPDRELHGSYQLESSSITIPWLTGRWSWLSLLPMALGNTSQTSKNNTDGAHHQGSSNGPGPHFSPKPRPSHPEPQPERNGEISPPDLIHDLIANPALYNPLRAPRFPIVLCHGLYGFDVRGPASFPSLRMHYWSNVLSVLRDKVGANVIVTTVPGTGFISSRAETLNEQLKVKAHGRGVNFLAHSMGGLDCRHLITHLKPAEYAPLSLTSVSTPHRGSPFMDWCVDNIGIGKLSKADRDLASSVARSAVNDDETMPWPTYSSDPSPSPQPVSGTSAKKDASTSALPFSLSLAALPSSFTTLLLSVVDSPAYAHLTTTYLNGTFNPATPDDPRVRYFSVASRLPSVSVWHPFWFTKMVVDGFEKRERERLRSLWERGEVEGGDGLTAEPLWANDREWGNDGLVTVQSAKWGEFLGIMEGCDHWEMRGARGLEIELPTIGASASEWGIKDWAQFVGAWKKEEKLINDAAQASKARGVPSHEASSSLDHAQIPSSSPTPHSTSHSAREERELRRQGERAQDDDVVKASTDKLSAVFDWIADQVPTPSLNILGVRQTKEPRSQKKDHPSKDQTNAHLAKEASAAIEGMKEVDAHRRRTTTRKRNELESKEDLERFYVALSRKLYDEGL
ncbi:hypothetical protein HGRIS_005628 [Hohenbuehelia grisea]|uniref:Alpha/beta-hydrolase n=1 Tax=Hohenbuehelia grisea TaxID=104357 RepID=A0ABR3JZG7_9AGAR